MPATISNNVERANESILGYDGCHLADVDAQAYDQTHAFVAGLYKGNATVSPVFALHSLLRFLNPDNSMTEEQLSSLIVKNGCKNLTDVLVQGVSWIQDYYTYK